MLKGVSKPMVPPDVPEYFMPLNRNVKPTESLVYQPMIVGAAQVVFSDQKSKVNIAKEQVFLAPVTDNPVPVNWDDAEEANMKITELRNIPAGKLFLHRTTSGNLAGEELHYLGKRFYKLANKNAEDSAIQKSSPQRNFETRRS